MHDVNLYVNSNTNNNNIAEPPNPQIQPNSPDVYIVGDDVDIYNLELWVYLIISVVGTICIITPTFILKSLSDLLPLWFLFMIVISIMGIRKMSKSPEKNTNGHPCVLVLLFSYLTSWWFFSQDVHNISDMWFVSNLIGLIHICMFLFQTYYLHQYSLYSYILDCIQFNMFLYITNFAPGSLNANELIIRTCQVAFISTIEIFIGRIHCKDYSVDFAYIIRIIMTLYRSNLYLGTILICFILVFRIKQSRFNIQTNRIEAPAIKLDPEIPYPFEDKEEPEPKEEEEKIEDPPESKQISVPIPQSPPPPQEESPQPTPIINSLPKYYPRRIKSSAPKLPKLIIPQEETSQEIKINSIAHYFQ